MTSSRRVLPLVERRTKHGRTRPGSDLKRRLGLLKLEMETWISAAIEKIERVMDYAALEERWRRNWTAKKGKRRVNERLANDVPVAEFDVARENVAAGGVAEYSVVISEYIVALASEVAADVDHVWLV